jgi:hypothetical protein
MDVLSVTPQTFSAAESIIKHFVQPPLNILHHPGLKFTEEELKIHTEQNSEAEGKLAILGLVGRGIGGEDAVDEARALMKRLRQAREEREAEERKSRREYRGPKRIEDWLAIPEPGPVEAPEEPEVLGYYDVKGGNLVEKVPDIEVEGEYETMEAVKTEKQGDEEDEKASEEG